MNLTGNSFCKSSSHKYDSNTLYSMISIKYSEGFRKMVKFHSDMIKPILVYDQRNDECEALATKVQQ